MNIYELAFSAKELVFALSFFVSFYQVFPEIIFPLSICCQPSNDIRAAPDPLHFQCCQSSGFCPKSQEFCPSIC